MLRQPSNNTDTMTTRNRHIAKDDAYEMTRHIMTCAVCGTESAPHDATVEFTPVTENDKRTVCLCEDCQQDFISETVQDDPENVFNSDVLPLELFEQVLEWARHTAVMSFTEKQNAVRTVEQVEQFFDALSAYLGWHPDTAFKQYVRFDDQYKTALAHDKQGAQCVEDCAACEDERVHSAIFTPEEASALDEVMQDCFKVVFKAKAGTGKDIYDYGMEALQRAGRAPKDDETPVAAHVMDNFTNTCVYCGSRKDSEQMKLSCSMNPTAQKDELEPASDEKMAEHSGGLIKLALELLYEASSLIPEDANERTLAWHRRLVSEIPAPEIQLKGNPVWASEFCLEYAVPALVSTLITLGILMDASWHNDVCPCFKLQGQSAGADKLILWTDHPNSDQREVKGEARFCVTVELEAATPLINTDSLEDALNCLFVEAVKMGTEF